MPSMDAVHPTYDDGGAPTLPSLATASTLRGVILPSSPEILHDISISTSGHVEGIEPSRTPAAARYEPFAGTLALPSLCHPHIHLDKAYLLSHPTTSHLQPKDGTFQEALSLTSEAKKYYTNDSIRERMDMLIVESVSNGVTHMRAFCEVDATVGLMCIKAGLEMKQRWSNHIYIQICAFAQDPVLSGENRELNESLMDEASGLSGVDVLGSTPYVEDGDELQRSNIRWAVRKACEKNLALDLHLDYNVDSRQQSKVWEVIEELREVGWDDMNTGQTSSGVRKTVCLGHCTRFTLFEKEEWTRLAEWTRNMPIYFVGLPTSDLFMQGRPDDGEELTDRMRATLQIPAMIGLGLKGTLGVNNVGNAFTPYGNGDPLEVARWGTGIYQMGTGQGAELLYECVSGRAKEAIGLGDENGRKAELFTGSRADFLVVGKQLRNVGPYQRRRKTVKEVVWDAGHERATFFGGKQILLPQ
jgi:cytosine/adenosine deaminase-related metal-dependent hydrolase